MQELKKNAFSYRTFPLLRQSPELIQGTFLRPYDFSDRNIEKIVGQIIREWKLDRLVYCHQIHEDNIHIVENMTGGNIMCISQTDALITKQKNIALCIRHADCQAALLYDRYNQVVSIAHAGWRGLIRNIYKKVIITMQEKFSTNPKDIVVSISPSLGPIASKYTHHRDVFSKYFYQFQIAPLHFDFWQLSAYQLIQMGIPKNNIEISKMCTFSSPGHFFSYRRTKTQMRNASLIGITN